MYVMSRDGCKMIDKKAIEIVGIPSIVLMENAANEVFSKIKDLGQSFTVICGTGNNGGDGLAIGRKLVLAKREVHFVIISPRENYSNDFNVNYNIIDNMNCKISFIKDISDIHNLKEIINFNEIIIDSIFGIGINKELNEFYKEVIKVINDSKKYIIAVDVPSGLDCNTGNPMGGAVKASTTYTFEVVKLGFINYNSFKYLGNLEVIPIGIPNEIKDIINEGVTILEDYYYRDIIRRREIYGHKGDYGRAIIFAGSKGFTGAAYLATKACLKTGAGLTALITPKDIQDILSGMLIESMTSNFNEEEKVDKLISTANAIAYGPGLPSSKEYEDFLLYISKNSSCHLVIDAEGINILSRRPEILDRLKGRMILTPHPGEMSRLVGKSISEVESDRINIAKEYAKKYKSIVLLKGYNTVITDGEKTYINTTGNSKMASGGSGDCLTGMIVSLLAQKHSPLESALIGAYVHGKAGEIAGKYKYSVTASDIIDNISTIIHNIIM
ncbi:NAD(P)H-hydrate dehydratase [Clostridium sp. NSJ-49]|uniref:NAD(P)H-hydrate dehydratase n=1 Tax=Clostridium TaxID=1485 RepID=UPI00164BB013|nr:NAD(P)H-hydrate dehydratase [Clostridium sp. NSJ-49]MBC5626990.1 NAD(P)H-hydrate dehydratase [Clostridium sp. NSJ-49]